MSCLTTSQRYNRKHPHSLIPRAWQTTRPPHLRISKGMIHLHPLHPPSLRKLHKNSPSLLHQNFGKALHHHGDRTNGVILDTRPWDRRGSCAGKSCTPRRTQGQQASFLCGLGLWNLWSSLSQWEQSLSCFFMKTTYLGPACFEEYSRQVRRFSTAKAPWPKMPWHQKKVQNNLGTLQTLCLSSLLYW